MTIREYLPNPVGSDGEGEYIKLLNDGAAAVDLSGWRLQDASGKIFKLDGYRLESGKELVLDFKTTRLTLNNNGETVFLYDSAGRLADQLSFMGNAQEGAVIVKDTSPILENLPGLNYSAGGAVYQFWWSMILVGIILSSLAICLIKYHEKNFIKKQRSN